jgi:hypothetical protein
MNPFRAWSTFWFRPVWARPLGAFRIVVGVLTLAQLALLAFEMDYWLTDQGMLQGAEARLIAGPWRPSPLQWVQDPVSMRVFFAATAAVALAFTVGWRTRVMGVLLYLMALSIHHRNIPSNCGPDNLLMIFLFYLMLSPCGAAYSLDARRASRRRGTVAEPLIVPWAQRLLQLHLCLIYFNTAILKTSGSTWLGGTAIHFVLHNDEFRRFDFTALAQYPILINVFTQAGLLTEFCLAFFLWFRPTRRWVIAAGLVLHSGVLLIVNVPLFGELMMACYLTFLSPDEFDQLLRALNPRNWFRSDRRTDLLNIRNLRIDGPDGLRGMHAPAVETAIPASTGS